MRGCPYPGCTNEFAMEYSIGKCPKCKQYISTCPYCQGYNRGFARFCRLCGKPIDKKKVENKFYTKKMQKTPGFIFNKFDVKKLDFIDRDETMGMPFLRFSNNRVIITTPGGFIFDWDFMKKEEIKRIKIPDTQILCRPVIYGNIFFFASKNTISSYNLMDGEVKDFTLKRDSLSVIAMVEWQEDLYALLIDTSKYHYVFGKLNTRNNELDDPVEINDRYFSANILATTDAIYLFSRKKVYVYRKKDGSVTLETIEDFTKKSLNIYGKLYLHNELNLLLVPGEESIIRVNPVTGDYSRLLKQLDGGYLVEYSSARIAVADDRGLHIFDYTGKKLAASDTALSMKNINFNQRQDSMQMVSDRLLFSLGFQSESGGIIIPWTLEEPRVLCSEIDLSHSGIDDNIASNIKVSGNFVGLVTAGKDEKIKEAVIWQF
ncbi:MAG: hypothetical protein PVH61_33925 [Candidatus Aminicenantes bacterium]|jgi:hypothetical protein